MGEASGKTDSREDLSYLAGLLLMVGFGCLICGLLGVFMDSDSYRHLAVWVGLGLIALSVLLAAVNRILDTKDRP